jgi:4-oxalocrotonate tautomerase
MPYVNVKITRDGVTKQQKAEIIKGMTDVLVNVLNKNPATTFVVIEEVETDAWGVGGEPVEVIRARAKKT